MPPGRLPQRSGRDGGRDKLRRNKIILTLPVLLSLAALTAIAANPPAPTATAPSEINGITAPSQEATLSMERPGLMVKINVKEGQQVKGPQGNRPGDVLIQLDDKAEQLSAAQLKAQAEDEIRIKAAQAQLDQKKIDFARTEEAFKRSGAATELEVQHAKVEVIIADLSLQLAQFQSQQDKLKYQEAQAQLERMKLLAPFDGVIEKLAVHEGESVDAAKPVLKMVRIDKLWIDLPVPCDIACNLSIGQQAGIVYRSNRETAGVGKVIHMASVADASSNTRLVRIELENTTGKPAGLHVLVNFAAPKKEEAAATQPAVQTKGAVNVSQGNQ